MRVPYPVPKRTGCCVWESNEIDQDPGMVLLMLYDLAGIFDDLMPERKR